MIQHGRSADCLDAEVGRNGFFVKTAGVEIDVIGLSGSGRQSLGKNTASGTKSGGVGRAGCALGCLEDNTATGHGPPGDGVIGGIGSGFEGAVGHQVLCGSGERSEQSEDDGDEKERYSHNYHNDWNGHYSIGIYVLTRKMSARVVFLPAGARFPREVRVKISG